ncbi:hypothetical protein D3C81_503930 [compost metagenome]
MAGEGGEQRTIPHDGLGIGQGGEPQQIGLAGTHARLLYLVLPLLCALHPVRVADHHPPRAGGIAQALEQGAEGGQIGLSSGPIQVLSQDQGIVLIGLLDLLAASLRAQHQQAHLLLHLGGDHQGEGLGDQLLVDGGDELHQKQGMDPLGKQGAGQLLLLPCHRLQCWQAVGSSDAQGQHMRVGGEEPQHLGQVKDPHHLLPLPDDQPLDAVAGHQQQGIEQIAALRQADQRCRGQHR